MRKQSHAKAKGRRENGSYTIYPHAVTNTRKYRSLSRSAKALMMDMGSRYNGKNNGDLAAPWPEMKEWGWRSSSTLLKAKKELLDAGFIVCTRHGWQNVPSLYALTWFAIDECSGKLEIPPTKAPLGTWRDDR
jgi:hypothetical protein